MSRDKTKLWYLKNLEVFNHLNDDEKKAITDYTNLLSIPKKGIIYFQGSADDRLYLVKEGAVKLTRLAPKGNEIILDIVGAGTIFGEMGADDGFERNESAYALEDCVVCSIKREDFQRVINSIPGFSNKVTRMKAPNGRTIENKLIDLLYRTVEQRLAITLLRLDGEFGEPHERGRVIMLKLTHNDLADLVASTRETVTASLSRLKEKGLVEYDGKHVVLVSTDGLKALLDGST